jgi:hypothetical protein
MQKNINASGINFLRSFAGGMADLIYVQYKKLKK